ncbi:hypothetical protein HDU81_007449 [Chytriomyces hyalinus]|nr:hypothetical protein HDU81_007449 [Chytriomyces hyalinus]
MSPSTDTSQKPIHLWVLHHGLWGHPDHLTLLAKTILDKASQTGESVQVLNIAVNSGTWTYAGVDGCGAKTVRIVTERLADTSKPRISHISFAGYSLGGLILRYAIGVLYAHGVFANPSHPASATVSNELGFSPVIAHKFVTFASPHLGTYNPTTANSGLYFRLASFLLARPGAQMLHQDRTGLDNRKMINVLADPALPFFQGLALFDERILYGNIINDNMVGHRTSTLLSITPQNSLEKQYIYTLPAINPDAYPSIIILKSPTELSLPAAASTSLAIIEPKPSVGEIIARGAWSVCFVVALTLQRWFWIGLQMYDGFTQTWQKPVSSNGPTGLLKLLAPSKEPSDWLKSWPSISNETNRVVALELVQESDDGDAYAFEQLNRLTWQRLHVRSKERRAHASIVGRINGNEDVIRHFGDTFLGAEKHRA